IFSGFPALHKHKRNLQVRELLLSNGDTEVCQSVSFTGLLLPHTVMFMLADRGLQATSSLAMPTVSRPVSGSMTFFTFCQDV
ncbi:hypothetical protein BaRGS_00007220, partial [Batillaria attramentaria]